MLKIYLQETNCIYVIRIQEEPNALSANDKIGATASPSDEEPQNAKEMTIAFDIRYPNLPPPIVEVRLRIQVTLPNTYQAHPLQTCRDILRVMSIQKKSENDEHNKREAEIIEANKKEHKNKRGGATKKA